MFYATLAQKHTTCYGLGFSICAHFKYVTVTDLLYCKYMYCVTTEMKKF